MRYRKGKRSFKKRGKSRRSFKRRGKTTRPLRIGYRF